MSVPLTEFSVYKDDKVNESQKNFIETFFSDVVPLANEEGLQIVVLSGAMGSGKSASMQYIQSLLCLQYPQMKWAIGRISKDDAINIYLKELKEMIPKEALAGDHKTEITFKNGSHVKCLGWGDGNSTKLRANNLHAFIMEEAVEDEGKKGTHGLNKRVLEEMFGRTRKPNAPNFIFLLTNPSDPFHWIYEDFIAKARYIDGIKVDGDDLKENVHVYYSKTTDNLFNQKNYDKLLADNLSPQQAERYLYGKWVSLATNGVYNEFSDDLHWFPDIEYKPNKNHPIILAWDFNTAEGKPMSACIGQYIDDIFHMYDEVVLYNSNTKLVLSELKERGFFDQFRDGSRLDIMGDASGRTKQPSADFHDYGLIKDFLDHLDFDINYKIKVPKKNPYIKARHNLVNSYLKNLNGDIRIRVYKGCETLRKGFKSTKLKKGSSYIEDDSNPSQHITTAFGYMLYRCIQKNQQIKKIKLPF